MEYIYIIESSNNFHNYIKNIYVRRGVFLLERTLSPEEKIRRAEEIYSRRRSGNTSRNIATVNVSNDKNYGLLKKMILQIAICLVIYFIFYLIQNSNYVFSQDIINKTNEILSYDINISEIFTDIMNGINSFSDRLDQNHSINNTIDGEENQDNNTVNTQMQNTIGGAKVASIVAENFTFAQNSNDKEENNEQVSNEEQKELTDEEYIKTFNLMKPIEGIVSSEFGIRDVDNPIVSKNHMGIDIAANTGTQIKAAMDGEVTISSTLGSYGYHIQITNNDVSNMYAHCSELLVNVGDNVTKGQVIAKVGSTGNSTNPHLHFEIKRGENYINPRDILEF